MTCLPSVRRAGPNDAAAILGIFDAVARECPWLIYVPGQRRPADLLPALQAPDSLTTYWLAPAEGVPMAALEIAQSALPALAHTATFGMAVLAAARRRGYGRALVRTAEAWAGERGVRKVTIVCAATNAPALRLYDACGYTGEGAQHHQFRLQGRWVDALWLAHWIKEAPCED